MRWNFSLSPQITGGKNDILPRYEDKVRFGSIGYIDDGPANDYVVQHKTVETLEEAEEWIANNYNEKHPPYAIKGEKIEFDFRTVAMVAAKTRNQDDDD